MNKARYCLLRIVQKERICKHFPFSVRVLEIKKVLPTRHLNQRLQYECNCKVSKRNTFTHVSLPKLAFLTAKNVSPSCNTTIDFDMSAICKVPLTATLHAKLIGSQEESNWSKWDMNSRWLQSIDFVRRGNQALYSMAATVYYPLHMEFTKETA